MTATGSALLTGCSQQNIGPVRAAAADTDASARTGEGGSPEGAGQGGGGDGTAGTPGAGGRVGSADGGSAGTPGSGGRGGATAGSGGALGTGGRVTATGGTSGGAGNTGTVGTGGSVVTGSGGASGTVAFPVSFSADRRYLQDRNGAPFPILGRTAWFVTSVAPADYQVFIQDTVARGYNSIELHVPSHDPRGNRPPRDGANNLPFLRNLDGGAYGGAPASSGASPDFTTPNEAFWAFTDAFVDYCQAQGILLFMFPAYVGYFGTTQGWMPEVTANGAARMTTYGAWIANRYKTRGNIVWMMGGDAGTGTNPFDSAQSAAEAGLLAGLKSVVGQQSINFSAEWNFASIGTDQPTFGEDMTLNGVYSSSGTDIATNGRRAYMHAPVRPAYLLEEPYDEEGTDGNSVNPNATQPVRRFQWWGWLSTIGGYISGNGYVWRFVAPDWRTHLDSLSTRDMAQLNGLIRSIPWWTLVPSGLNGMKTLVTAGAGTGTDLVTAAANPAGTLLVAYVPPDHSGTVTIDMTAMSATTRARWFNPTTGAYTAIGSFPNTGTRAFTPPANNGSGFDDWTLVLDTSP